MGASAGKRTQEELTAAIKNGNAVAVREFLERLSSARASDSGAAAGAEAQALREVNLDAPLLGGHTALQLSAIHGHAEVAGLLLMGYQQLPGVDPNGVGSQHRTALHFAASSRRPRVVAELLYNTADPCIAAADDGNTPLDAARKAGCMRSVQAIEASTALWRGLVDYYEQELLVIPTWKTKWLVVLRDRRPNTGPKQLRTGSSRPCSRCGAAHVLPKLVSRFPCDKCGADIDVPASLALSIYSVGANTGLNSNAPDVGLRGVLVQPLPQDPSRVTAKAAGSASTKSSMGALFEGKLQRAMQNAVSSERAYGLVVEVLGSAGDVRAEHCFRFGTAQERATILEILKDPARASIIGEGGYGNFVGGAGDPGYVSPWTCERCGCFHEGNMANLVFCTACGAQSPGSFEPSAPPGTPLATGGLRNLAEPAPPPEGGDAASAASQALRVGRAAPTVPSQAFQGSAFTAPAVDPCDSHPISETTPPQYDMGGGRGRQPCCGVDGLWGVCMRPDSADGQSIERHEREVEEAGNRRGVEFVD
mmetsp:Transcript_55115/g.155066  ORF Transcript_55115/g.155066 Transcript_55115/m.155066 type:complete len:535 (-) Transcript_55115:102-1706(-)